MGDSLNILISKKRNIDKLMNGDLQELEGSAMNFLIFDSSKDGPFAEGHPFVGWSWGGSGVGDLAIPASVRALRGGLTGASAVNFGAARAARDDPANVAWHEAAHLRGLVRGTSKNAACTEPFRGRPNPCHGRPWP